MTLVSKRTPEDHAHEYLLIFLNNILNGDDRYKELVIPVIREAQQLVRGEKDYYSISREYFHNILVLRDHCSDILETINPDGIDQDEWQHLYNKLVAASPRLKSF